MTRIYISLFFILIHSVNLFSQRGKDGTVTISTANTVVNLYTPLIQNATVGTKTINVLSSASYNVGDLVFIIQMQGASVNAGRDTLFPDVASSIPTNTTFGAITNYNNCGNNEYAQINAVPNATTIVIDCGLKNNYAYLANVQVIKVPRYFDLTINAGGSITCPTWNGSTGGIAIVEIQNNGLLNSTPSFSVTAKGFRGGGTENNSTAGGNKFGSIRSVEGAYKGESIAGDTTRYKVYAAVFARGAIANGGGGGCAHNAGGGGGANGGNILTYDGLGNPVTGYTAAWNLEGGSFSTHTSSGGGRGGYSWSQANANPATIAPGSGSWNGDQRRNVGGYGGRSLDYSTGKIFIGGGGGSGDGNNNQAGRGANGGGMVYVVCYGNLTGAGTIEADGGKGSNTVLGCSSNDGAGGGGGGGTIILNVNGTIGLTAPIALTAKGGDGGNVNFNCILSNSEAYGTGASGGGGYISTSGVLPANNLSAGVNGIVIGNSGNIATNFPPNGATRGGVGSSGSINNYTLIATSSISVCTSQSFTLTATSTNPSSSISWYTTSVGGIAIASGTTFTSTGYSTVGTYTLFAGDCSGTYRQPVIIYVSAGLTLSVNSPTICSGQTAVLTPTGATTYTWSTGSTANTISVTPASSTVYTVTGTSGVCVGTRTTMVTVLASPSLSVNSPSICSGSSVVLTGSGASTFTWLPSGVSASSISVNPASTTVYTVIAGVGSCTSTVNSTVTVIPTPTISLASQTICAGQTAILIPTGATSYSWSTGATSNTIAVSPASTSVYTVTGATSSCIGTKTVMVTVLASPSLSVNSPSICSGSSVVLTGSGASTFTWLPSGVSASSISVNPASTTVYTVIAGVGSCTSTVNSTVTVIPTPTISLASQTICAGQTATLIPTGATSYSWSNGSTSNTLTVTSTTIYTLTGFNGVCSSSLTVSVIVNTVTPTTFSITIPLCTSQSTVINAGTSSATTYTWSNGVNTYSQTVSPTSTTTYTVLGNNTSNCPVLVGVTTLSITNVIANYTGINEPFVTQGTTLNLLNTSNNALTYLWRFCDGSTSTLVNQTFLAKDTGICCIKLIAFNGTCIDSVNNCFTIIGEVSIITPNVFTPNNDGKNDIFKFKTMGVKTLNCSIYDRWGLKLYSWEGLNGGWNGKTPNGEATDGTYYYILNYTDYKDVSVNKKGFFQLFKD